MRLLDPIELGEARAERFEDRFKGHNYLCSCGRTCHEDELATFSCNPYAEPFCPACIEEACSQEADTLAQSGRD